MPVNNSFGQKPNKQVPPNIGISESTAATLGKYGIKTPPIQQGNPISVTPNKITIINNNNTTTNNQVSSGGGSKEKTNNSPASKFKTWLGKVNMQQAEMASKRDRDYARRESSLTRSANKMLRRIEKVGSSVAEAFTPESFGQTIGSQLKMYLLIFGMKFLSNHWEKVLKVIRGIGEMFNTVTAWLGIGQEGEAMARRGKGLIPTVIRVLGGIPGKESVMDAFKNTMTAAFDHFSMKLDHMMDERAQALKKIKFNYKTDGIFGDVVKGLGIENIFQGITTYLGDILIALANPKAGTAKSVARDVQQKGLEGSMNNMNIGQYTTESFGVDRGDLSVIDKSNKHRYGLVEGAVGPGNILTGKAGGQISQSLDIIGALMDAKESGYVDPARFLAGLERLQDKAKTAGYVAVDPEFLTTFLSVQTIKSLTAAKHIRYRKYKVVKVKKDDAHRMGDYVVGAITGGFYSKTSAAAAAKSRKAAAAAAKTARKAGKSAATVGKIVIAGKTAAKAAKAGGLAASWFGGGLLETTYDDMMNNDYTLEFVPLDDPRESFNGKAYILCEIDEHVLRRIAQSFGTERFDTSNEELMEQARRFMYQRAGGFAATKERYKGKGRNESISISETYKPIHHFNSIEAAHKKEEESHPFHQRAAVATNTANEILGGAVTKSKEVYQDTKDFFTKPTGKAPRATYNPADFVPKSGVGPRTANSIVHVDVTIPSPNDYSNTITFSIGAIKSPIKTQYTFSTSNAVEEAERLSKLIITEESPGKWRVKSSSDMGKSNYLAKYTRLAIAKGLGKLDLEDKPRYPYEYVNILYKYGFVPVEWKSYSPKKGDICIFGPTANKFRGGYSCIFSGSKWISDHEQSSIWPDEEFRDNNLATVFRHLNISDHTETDVLNGQYKVGSSQVGFLDFSGNGQWDAFRSKEGKIYELDEEGRVTKVLTENEFNSRLTSESNFIASPESSYDAQKNIINYKGDVTEADPGAGGYSIDLNFDGGKINNPPKVNITTSGYNLVLWRYHKLPSGVDSNNALEGVIYEHGTGKILAWTIESEYQIARCKLTENPSEIVPGGATWPNSKPYHRGCSSYVVNIAKGRGGFGKNIGDPDTVLAIKTPSRGKTRCLFHPGSDVSWTTGCILVGDKAKGAKRKVSTAEFGIDRIRTSQHPSVVYWRNLYDHIVPVICSGQKVYLYFVNGKGDDVSVGSSAGVQSAAGNYVTEDVLAVSSPGIAITGSGGEVSLGGGNAYSWNLSSNGGNATGSNLTYASYDITALQKTAREGGIDVSNPVVQAALNHTGGYTSGQQSEFVRDLYLSFRAAGLSHLPAVMAVSQAVQESGYGTSASARGGNNYGGIAATKRNPTWGGSGSWAGFKNMGHYAQEKVRLLSINYSGALTATTPEEYMRAVQGLDANGNPIPGAKVYCATETRNGVHSDRFGYVNSVIGNLDNVNKQLEKESATINSAATSGATGEVEDFGAGKVFDAVEKGVSKASEVVQTTYNDVKNAIKGNLPSKTQAITLENNASKSISAMSDDQLAAQIWLNNTAIRNQYDAYGFEGWKKYVFDKLPTRKDKERYLVEEEGKALLASTSYLSDHGHYTGLQNILGFEINPDYIDRGVLTSEGLSLFGAVYASMSPEERNTFLQRVKLESSWQEAKDKITEQQILGDYSDDELKNFAELIRARGSHREDPYYSDTIARIIRSEEDTRFKNLYKYLQLGNLSEAKKILEDYYAEGNPSDTPLGYTSGSSSDDTKLNIGFGKSLGGLLSLSQDQKTTRIPNGGYNSKDDKYTDSYEVEDFDLSEVYVKDALARAFAKKQYDELQGGINKFLQSDIYKKYSELKNTYDSEGYRNTSLSDAKAEDFDDVLSFVNGMYNLFKDKYVQTHLTEGFEDILETDSGAEAYEKNQRNQRRAEINKQKYDIKYRQEHWNEDYYDRLEKDSDFRNTMYWRYGFGDEANRAMYGSREGRDEQTEFNRQLEELNKQMAAIDGSTYLGNIDKIQEKFDHIIDGTTIVTPEEQEKVTNYSITGDQVYDTELNYWMGLINQGEKDKKKEVEDLEEYAKNQARIKMQDHMVNNVWLPLMNELANGSKSLEEVRYVLTKQGLGDLISNDQLKNIKKGKKFNENLLSTRSELDSKGNLVTKWYGADNEEIQTEDYERDAEGNIIFDKKGNPKRIKRSVTLDDSEAMEKVIENAHKKESLMGGVREGDVTLKVNGKNLSLYSYNNEMFYLDRNTGERYDIEGNKLTNINSGLLNNVLGPEAGITGIDAPKLVSQATATQHMNFEKRLREGGITYGGETFKLNKGQAASDVLTTQQLDISNYKDADSMIEGLKEILGKDDNGKEILTNELENYLRDQYSTDKTKKVELTTFRQNGLTMSGAFVDGKFQLFPDDTLAAKQLNAIEAHAKKLGYSSEEAKIYADNQFRQKSEWAEVQQRMKSEHISYDAIAAEYITKIYDELTIIQNLVGVESHHSDVKNYVEIDNGYVSPVTKAVNGMKNIKLQDTSKNPLISSGPGTPFKGGPTFNFPNFAGTGTKTG